MFVSSTRARALLNHEPLGDLEPGLEGLARPAHEPQRFGLVGPGEGGAVGTLL